MSRFKQIRLRFKTDSNVLYQKWSAELDVGNYVKPDDRGMPLQIQTSNTCPTSTITWKVRIFQSSLEPVNSSIVLIMRTSSENSFSRDWMYRIPISIQMSTHKLRRSCRCRRPWRFFKRFRSTFRTDSMRIFDEVVIDPVFKTRSTSYSVSRSTTWDFQSRAWRELSLHLHWRWTSVRNFQNSVARKIFHV